jgi:hypothetical protein
MRKRRVIGSTIAAAAVLLAGALAARATVYQNVGSVFERARFAAEAAGKVLYRAVMQINGGRANVTVVNAKDGVESLGRQMLAAGGNAEAGFKGDAGFGMGFVKGYGQTLRMLALDPARRGEALVVAVEQSDREAADSRSGRIAHDIPDVPDFPGGTVTCMMRNTDTRTSFETVRAPGSAGAVEAFYAGALARSGWKPVFPAGSPGGTGVQVLGRGADICLVRIKGTESVGESEVTLLHKRGATP